MEFSSDFGQTNIDQTNYFTFLLPATAFGIEDKSMIAEISAEYFPAPDGKTYRANVWARQKGATVKYFIYPVSVPVSPEPEKSIINVLNDDEVFHKLMRKFLYVAAKYRCD